MNYIHVNQHVFLKMQLIHIHRKKNLKHHIYLIWCKIFRSDIKMKITKSFQSNSFSTVLCFIFIIELHEHVLVFLCVCV